MVCSAETFPFQLPSGFQLAQTTKQGTLELLVSWCRLISQMLLGRGIDRIRLFYPLKL